MITAAEAAKMVDESRKLKKYEKLRLAWVCGCINKKILAHSKRGKTSIEYKMYKPFADRAYNHIYKLYKELGYKIAVYNSYTYIVWTIGW